MFRGLITTLVLLYDFGDDIVLQNYYVSFDIKMLNYAAETSMNIIIQYMGFNGSIVI